VPASYTGVRELAKQGLVEIVLENITPCRAVSHTEAVVMRAAHAEARWQASVVEQDRAPQAHAGS
jgi:hypothetical protein